jgi:transcriptional antiterminator RfaH
MPLLAEEPVVFPPNLFEGGETSADDRWWVLHTRPRAEKTLARQLFTRQISYFLPQYQRNWRYRGRRLSSYLPVFSGYVFLFGDPDARVRAVETNLVANTLTVVDQDQLYQDLRRVHQLIASGLPLAPEARLLPGEPVEVVSGPFTGMEGKILQRNKMRFVVEVRFLQQGVSVDMEGWMIRPLIHRPLLHET